MPKQSKTQAPVADVTTRVRRPLVAKIVLTVLLFVIPLVGVTIYFLLKGPNKDIEFAVQEKKGNAFLRPLERLLDAVPRRQLSAGDAKASTQVDTEIDAALSSLSEVQSRLGEDLLFTVDGLAKAGRSSADPATIKNMLESLRNASAGEKETQAKYDQLVNAISTAITHAGDKSNLILDPDLDSYYVMDVTLNTLPQMSRRLAALGIFLKSPEAQNNANRAQLAVFAAQIGDDIEAIRNKFEIIESEDPNFYGSSPTLRANTNVALGDAGRNVDKLLELLKPASTGTDSKLDFTSMEKAAADARSSLSQLWGKSVGELDALLDLRVNSLANTRLTGLLITAGLLLAASLVAYFILRTITGPVAALSTAVAKVSEGDESARAPVISQDEIGQLAEAFNSMVMDRSAARQALQNENARLQANIQDLLLTVSDASDGKLDVRAKVTEGALGNLADALNLMLENVGDLVSQAKTASDQVANSAQQIEGAASLLERSAGAQVEEMQQTSQGVQNLSGQADIVLRNCQSATTAAQTTHESAEKGFRSVQQVVDGMQRIREIVQANSKKIKRLGDRSLEISQIVKFISEISAKTDILALNAAIEASRAGEQGRGFTVVAEEVRALADRTRSLTAQIEGLVSNIQTETAEAVVQMEEQTSEVERGAQTAVGAGQALESIVAASDESAQIVQTINKAAEQQAASTGKMLTSVESVTQLVSNTLAQVRQASDISKALAQVSKSLTTQLNQFEVSRN